MRMNVNTKANKRKKAVNLSIDEDLLAAARAQGLNLSAILERALSKEQARLWLAENSAAIEAYNEDIRQNGVWSDGMRDW